MNKSWTHERIESLREVWMSGMPIAEMAEKYGVKEDTIYAWCSRRFKFGRRTPHPSHNLLVRNPEAEKFLRKNYPHMGDAILAVYLDCSVDCVHDTAVRLGLKKTEEFVRDSHRKRLLNSWKTRKKRKHEST